MSWVGAESCAPTRGSFNPQASHAATWRVSPNNGDYLMPRLVAALKLAPEADPAQFPFTPHSTSEFLLQSTRRWLGFSQCASRVVLCECPRPHRLLAGASTPCNDVGILARAGSAGAARFGLPQRDALTLPSGAGGAAIGYGTCDTANPAVGATPVQKIHAQPRNFSPAPVSHAPPGGTAAS